MVKVSHAKPAMEGGSGPGLNYPKPVKKKIGKRNVCTPCNKMGITALKKHVRSMYQLQRDRNQSRRRVREKELGVGNPSEPQDDACEKKEDLKSNVEEEDASCRVCLRRGCNILKCPLYWDGVPPWVTKLGENYEVACQLCICKDNRCGHYGKRYVRLSRSFFRRREGFARCLTDED